MVAALLVLYFVWDTAPARAGVHGALRRDRARSSRSGFARPPICSGLALIVLAVAAPARAVARDALAAVAGVSLWRRAGVHPPGQRRHPPIR